MKVYAIVMMSILVLTMVSAETNQIVLKNTKEALAYDLAIAKNVHVFKQQIREAIRNAIDEVSMVRMNLIVVNTEYVKAINEEIRQAIREKRKIIK